MTSSNSFRIAVLPGDGIGTEVMGPTQAVLDAAAERVGGFALSYEEHPGGALHYRDTGTALPDESFKGAEQADAVLFGAMGWPEIRYPDGTEIAPQLDLRFNFELYAGVRPIRLFPGAPTPLKDPRAADIDFVLIRESTEGLFSTRGTAKIEGDRVARDVMEITRPTCEKLFDFTFRLGASRKAAGQPGQVTCIDKANVLTSMAFFRKVFDERATAFPDLEARHHYVDAAALDLVRRPWDFDVMVTENMFGDILSDLAAALVGGMGMAPSADIGDKHAVFQPSHGSAPDIAGQGKANPLATILSGAMMLTWLGERHGAESAGEAARLIEAAVEKLFADGAALPYDLGGRDGTKTITDAVLERL